MFHFDKLRKKKTMLKSTFIISILVMISGVDNMFTEDASNRSLDNLFHDEGIRYLAVNKHYLLVGEHLTVQCNLSMVDQHNGSTSHLLSFERRSSTDAPKSLCFDDADVYRPSSDVAILNISATPEMAGHYYCYKEPHCMGDSIGMFGDVNVEYAPQKLKNISCVILNWETMQCSWNDPVSYVNPPNIHYDLKYTEGKRRTQIACPNLSTNMCNWTKITMPKDYTMTVTATNKKLNISVQSHFTVHTNDIIKPDPVEALITSSSPDKPGCLHLKWTHAKNYWDKVFRIKVKSVSHDHVENGGFKVLIDNLTSLSYDACGFLAYTRLKFTVEAHSGYRLGYWSKPEYSDGWTPQEAPTSGPKIAPGSFVVNKSSDTSDYEITFYWNQVEVLERNGIIDSYQLETPDGSTKTVSNSTRSLSSTLPISHSGLDPFSINIYAHTTEGYSKYPSTWLMDPLNTRVPENIQDSFVAKVVDDKLILDWKNSHRDLYNITVYWCYGSNPIGKCEEPLHWRRIDNARVSRYTIPNLRPEDYIYYSYGLSVEKSNEISSGIYWTQCMIRPTKRSPVTFTCDPLIKSVRVSWERHVCSYHTGFLVKQYYVKWCIKSECKDPTRIKSMTISPKNNTYVIKDLQVGTEYQATLQMMLEDGQSKEGQWTEVVPLKEKSKKDGISTGVVIEIVVSVVAIIAITFLVIVCVCICRKRREKSRKNIPLPPPCPSDSSSSASSSSGNTYSGGSYSPLGSRRPLLNIDDSVKCQNGEDQEEIKKPELPSTKCPSLPRPTVILESESRTDLPIQGKSTTDGLAIKPDDNFEVDSEVFANKAFQYSGGENLVKVQNTDSGQNSLPPYHQIAMVQPSGETVSSSETSINSLKDNCGSPLSEQQEQKTVDPEYVQNPLWCANQGNSSPADSYLKVSPTETILDIPVQSKSNDSFHFSNSTFHQKVANANTKTDNQIKDLPILNIADDINLINSLKNLTTSKDKIKAEDENLIAPVNDSKGISLECQEMQTANVFLPDVNILTNADTISDIQRSHVQIEPSPPQSSDSTTLFMDAVNDVSDFKIEELFCLPQTPSQVVNREGSKMPENEALFLLSDSTVNVNDNVVQSQVHNTFETPATVFTENIPEIPTTHLSNLSHPDYVQSTEQTFGHMAEGQPHSNSEYAQYQSDPSDVYIVAVDTNVVIGSNKHMNLS